MARLAQDLHCHREPADAEQLRPLIPQAAQIARTRMEAFNVAYEIEQSDTTLEIFTNMPTPARDMFSFPKPSGLSLGMQQSRHSGWTTAHVAAVETALAWQQAGLIHHFCDLFRWKRDIDALYTNNSEERDQIARGLEALGVPRRPPQYTHHLPIRPDPQAVQLALDLSNHLDSGRVAVFLIGSRARGDHQPGSDIDLLIYTDENTSNEYIERTRRRARRFIRTNTVSLRRKGVLVDSSIVREWHNPAWRHHSEKLAPATPNGLAFAKNPELLEQTPISLAEQGSIQGGLAFHFLTAGAEIINVGDSDWARKDALDLMRCK